MLSGQGVQGPLAHTSLAALCAGIWALPELLRATQPADVCWPCSPFPILPPGCAGIHLPIRKESTLALAGRVFHAGNIFNSYFFTQVRTKISLSHPSPAAVTDITPATLVFPGPSPVTELKSWHLQLLLL